MSPKDPCVAIAILKNSNLDPSTYIVCTLASKGLSLYLGTEGQSTHYMGKWTLLGSLIL